MDSEIVLIGGAFAVSISLPIAVWSLTAGRDQHSSPIGGSMPTPATMRESALNRSLTERLVAPAVRFVGFRMTRLTPAGWLESRSALLTRAGLGERFTAEQLVGAKIILPILVLLLTASRITSGDNSLRSNLMMLTLVACTFLLPDMVVRNRADKRSQMIISELPDFLDQLTISVEAGLSFDAALTRMVQAGESELNREFSRMLRDTRLGTSRGDALASVVERTQVDDLKTMVLSLRQSDTLGVPLARSLRTLSTEMREKRRSRAEEKARQLPVKLIFPLALFIMPAMFIVMLAPAVIRFSGAL